MKPFRIRNGNHYRARDKSAGGFVWTSSKERADVYTELPPGNWETEPADGGGVQIKSFDYETFLIRPGVTAPEAVCLTWQSLGDPQAGIVHANDAFDLMRTWLRDPNILFSGANTAFDMAVTCANFPELVDLVFDAYDADRVTDVQIRQKLLDIAGGIYQGYPTPDGGWVKPKYSLEFVAKRYNVYLDKPEMVVGPGGKKIPDPMHARLRFSELVDFPVHEWDERAKALGFRGPPPTQYAKEDAVATLVAHLGQDEHADPYLRRQFHSARKQFALYLWSAWGVRTDAGKVTALSDRTQTERNHLKDMLVEAGFVRADGSRDTKAAAAYMLKVCQESGLAIRRTPAGGVQLDEDACDATGDALLEAYADYTRLGTVLNKDVAALMKGTVYPIHTRFDIAATDRTTSSNPNNSNWGRAPGPRECFVPRPGFVFAQADYDGLELRTLAQCCVTLFGKSKLGEALNAGKDPHLQMGADMLRIPYEEARTRYKAKDHLVVDARQAGKVANFGFPGGLGAEKLSLWARKTYGITLSVARAKELKAQWLGSWPEMVDFFEYINRLCSTPSGLAEMIEVPISGWMRGGAPYCAACNTHFQSLGAAAAGRGVWYLTQACYRDRKSVLFGSRCVNHIHDENFLEVKDDSLAHEKAIELERLMVKGANEYLPDVPAKAPPVLMRYWSKDAWALTDSNGRLIPWNGEKAA